MSVQTDESFTAGNPEVVFEGDYHFFQGGPNYDVSLNGDRFLMVKQVGNEAGTFQIIIVQNWFAELERLVPTAE